MSILNFLSIDLEEWFQVYHLREAVRADAWDGYPERINRNTLRLLELLDRCGTSATFFVLGWVANKYPRLIRMIHDAGHEIATHGYSHQMVYELSPENFAAEIRDSKKNLEDIIGGAVHGHRASNFSIVHETLWALDILAEQGIAYDSSIYPVRRERYGIPRAPLYPYRLRTPAGRDIIEVPLSAFTFLGRRIPICGGGTFRLYPYAATRHFISDRNAHGKPAVFYIHPWEFDPDQPRQNISWSKSFQHYCNLEKTELKFVRMLSEFKFGTFQKALENSGFSFSAAAVT